MIGKRHGDGAPVDVIDGDQDEEQQEELPADVGAPLHAVLAGFVRLALGCLNCCWIGWRTGGFGTGSFGAWKRHSFSFTGKICGQGKDSGCSGWPAAGFGGGHTFPGWIWGAP